MATSDVMISGIGQSAVAGKLEPSGLPLTVDATLEAIADAGLEVKNREVKEIGGIETFPEYRPDAQPFSPVGTMNLKDSLGFELDWFAGDMEGPFQLSAFINAYAAIRAGLARHVVCFRTFKEGTGGASWKESATPTVGRTRADSEFHHIFRYNWISATIWLGVYAQGHFNLYRRSLGPNGAALVNRFRVSDLQERNPQFFWIVGIYVTTRKQMWQIADGVHGRAGWHQANVPDMAAFDAGAALWSRTDVKASDVDVALLDDGFSFLTMTWLAALVFCSKGESGAFVEGARRIALDGGLPLNPHGGQLNAGRTHGFGFVHEAVT